MCLGKSVHKGGIIGIAGRGEEKKALTTGYSPCAPRFEAAGTRALLHSHSFKRGLWCSSKLETSEQLHPLPFLKSGLGCSKELAAGGIKGERGRKGGRSS